jgi:hypothetical protein
MRVTEGIEGVTGQRVQRDCSTVAKLLPSAIMITYRATPEQVRAVLSDATRYRPQRAGAGETRFEMRGLKARVEGGANG